MSSLSHSIRYIAIAALASQCGFVAAAQLPFLSKIDDARYEQLIKKGSVAEIYNEAVRLENGIDTTRDYEMAARLYERAAELGSIEATNNLGYLYEHGLGVDVDEEKAAELYKHAAKRNYAIAVYNLGVFYLKGKGIKRDLEEGKRLLLQARAMGVEQADFYISRFDRIARDAKPQPAREIQQKVESGSQPIDKEDEAVQVATADLPVQVEELAAAPVMSVPIMDDDPAFINRKLNGFLNPSSQDFSLYEAEQLLLSIKDTDAERYQAKHRVFEKLMEQRCQRVATRGANVRGGPGIEYPVTGWLQQGDRVCALREVEGWSQVNIFHKVPHVGWISNSVLP